MAKHRYIYFLDQFLAITPDGAGLTLSEKRSVVLMEIVELPIEP